MRHPQQNAVIISGEEGSHFPVALHGRAARPKARPANDNARSSRYFLQRALSLTRKALPPLIGSAVIIYAMTH